MKKQAILLLWLVALLAGCQLFSGTRVENVSSQKPLPGTMRKLLVIGVNSTPEIQAEMERDFARSLAGKDRQVVLASQWFPGAKPPSREEVSGKVEAEGVTGVLVVRLLDYEVTGEKEPAPAFSLYTPGRVPGARVGWQQEPWMTGFEDQQGREVPALLERKALVETNLYDVASRQMVWQAHTRTILRSDNGEEMKGFVFTIVNELRKSGWL
jgi:hypothetical protein